MILMVVEASIFIFMMLLTIFNCPAQGTDLVQDFARWHSSLRAYMPAQETISASPGFDENRALRTQRIAHADWIFGACFQFQ